MNCFVAIIIRDDENKFLFVNHSKKKEYPWRFPGGKVEVGEQAIMAAARELFEELGITANSLALYKQTTAFADGAEWTGCFYICTSYNGVPTIQEPDKQSALLFARVAELPVDSIRPNEAALAIELEESAGAFYRNGERWMYFPRTKREGRLLDMAPNLEAEYQLNNKFKAWPPAGGGCAK